MSAANSDLYIGSRTLYGLAVEGKAPAIFKKVNRMGVPWPSLITCTLFCGLVFLNVKSSSAKGNFSLDDMQLTHSDDIFRSYIIIPVFFGLWLGYKLYYQTALISSENVDLVTGKQQIDEEEEKFIAEQEALGPRSPFRKFWESL
ncbi:hypothetical protein C0993_011542 [Termitomyces sp. T159_Od127]|nr:hypothetical protein C0993_011542 [Termitomyces sp. T159_Od127]